MNIKHFKKSMAAAALTALVSLPAMADYRIVYPSGGAEKTEATAGLAVSLLSSEINGNTITLNYDKDLGSGPLSSAFAVDVNGIGLSVNTASVSGSTLTLGLNAAVNGNATVTLSYSDPSGDNDSAAIQSDSGTDAVSFTQVLTNTSASAGSGPSFVSASITGASLTASFDETLSGTGPSLNSLNVKVNGTAAAISSYSVSGSVLTVTLAVPARDSDTVTFSYTDYNLYIDDTSALQAADGRDADSVADGVVTNNTPPTPAAVESVVFTNGTSYQTIVINFDAEVRSDIVPSHKKFSFRAGTTSYGYPNAGLYIGNTNGKGWVRLRYQYKKTAFNSPDKRAIYSSGAYTGLKLVDSNTGSLIPSFSIYE